MLREEEIPEKTGTKRKRAEMEEGKGSACEEEVDEWSALEECRNSVSVRVLRGSGLSGLRLPPRSSTETGDRRELNCPSWGRSNENIFYYEITTPKSTRRTTTLPGRAWFDTYTWSRNQLAKERSYRLGALAMKYLKNEEEFKEDMPYQEIIPHFRKDADSRAILASYCLQDCMCALKYAQKRLAFTGSYATARLTGLTMTRFLGTKVQSWVYHFTVKAGLENGVYVPWVRSDPFPGAGSYVGGHVFEVEPGYYEHYVFTLDFASLYPTVERAHNLCGTTLIHESRLKQYKPEEYERCPDGYCYLKREKGLLPIVLEGAMGARKQAKFEMKGAKEAGDMALYNALDARQLALKLVCNTVYGMTGTPFESGGMLPCLPVAKSTTAWGRWHIKAVARYVEEKYPERVKRIGGDTDSVILFARFEERDDASMFKLGNEICEGINRSLPAPMKLEFENIYPKYIYCKKKGYAGSYAEADERGFYCPPPPKDIKIQGLECKRMDFPIFVAETQYHALRAACDLPLHCPDDFVLGPPPENVYGDSSVKPAARVFNIVNHMLQHVAYDKVSAEGYLISRELTKDKYKSEPPHVRIARRLKEISPETAPQLYERVSYLLVKQGNQVVPVTVHDMERNGLAIARGHYLVNHFANVMERTFDNVVGSRVLYRHITNVPVHPSVLKKRNVFYQWMKPKNE